MDNTFQVINELLFNKREEQLNDDELKLFAPYLTNRYISMYSNQMCEYVNEILNNKHYVECLEPSDLYRLYWHSIPKLRFKKINYIKKQGKPEKVTLTKKEEEYQTKIKMFARNKELSLKEVEALVEIANKLFKIKE